MRFDWWHPEYTAKCFIIVTIIEIHRLILDVFLKLSFTAVQRLFRYTLCSVYPNTHRLTGNTCCRTVHARWTRCND